MLSRLMGLAIVFGMIGLAIGAGGDIAIFINLPSAILVLSLFAGGLLMSYGLRQILSAVDRSISSRNREISPETLALYLAVFGRAYQLAWGAGLFGSIMGLIQMLANLSDPASISAGIAVSSVPTLYGVVLAEFIVNPLKHSLIAQSPETFAKLGAGHGKTNKTTPAFVIAFWVFLAIYTLVSITFRGNPGPDAFMAPPWEIGTFP